jgi:hypothetical protein
MTAPAGYNGADGGAAQSRRVPADALGHDQTWGTTKKGGLRPPLSFRILIVVRLQQ